MLFRQAKHYGKRAGRSPTLVVVHTMEYPKRANAAEWCSGFFTDPKGPKGPVVASAHYNVDSDSITQSVLEKDVAYHAGPVNEYSIGIEHAGYAGQTADQWRDEYSTAMLERSAGLVADICRRHGIPVRRLTAADLKTGERRGVCGHVDVTNGLQGGKGHVDPGRSFPWDWYLERVRAHLGPDEAAFVEPAVVTPENVAGSSVDLSSFVPIQYGGETWLVCPIYIAPVGIGEARELAKSLGCELPSPALVDAIWRAADLRVPPNLMIRSHDGTPATMNSPEIHARQVSELASFVGSRSLGKDFNLLAGAFKDVVVHNGKLGLYGWHVDDTDEVQVSAMKRLGVPLNATVLPGPGRVVQPFFSGHSPAWRDYSQGLRLVKRASA